MTDCQRELRSLLHEAGLIDSSTAVLQPLTGGVSSEICLVTAGEKQFVVKRALSKLRVEADWFADPVRNQYEQAFIDEVGKFLPSAVPNIYYRSAQFFTMEYFDSRYENWKAQLLAGHFEPGTFETAATVLATIHDRSAGSKRFQTQFDNTENFYDLRIESYLVRTAEKHPELAQFLNREAERLAASRECLVHGDYSPKNMLVSPERFVLLDSEVAWYGDPAFDLAFLLNHFLLKALYHVPTRTPLAELASRCVQCYFGTRSLTEYQCSKLDCRTAHLLTMLLLARVDGKSPVEYLTDTQKQNYVRSFSTNWMPDKSLTLQSLMEHWFAGLAAMQ